MYEDPDMMLRLARERQVELCAMAASLRDAYGPATSGRAGTWVTRRLSQLLNNDVVLRRRWWPAWRGPRETSGG